MRIKLLQDCSPELLRILATWHHEQWSYLNPARSFEKRLERMQRYLGDDFIPSTWVMIDNTGMPLGSAAIVAEDMDTHKHLGPWLASVYVAKQARRHGIGSQLVQQVMTAAQENAVEQLYLFTPDQSAFYERLGWEHLEHCDYRGHAVSVMVYNCAKAAAN